MLHHKPWQGVDRLYLQWLTYWVIMAGVALAEGSIGFTFMW